jgi:pantoate--beta-alanine ligase
MGALHPGHISLLEQSKKETYITVCSIFVNPTQFNDRKDYEKYPVTIEEDIQKIEAVGTDILFLPDASALYENGTHNLEHYDIGYLETVLEGEFRPGHFQGVCQVMYRLLKTVKPAKLFMGQKDYQQSLVIRQLLNTMKINTDLIVSPTFREKNGLAMSSRNMRLSEKEREAAGSIYQALIFIKDNMRPGSLTSVKEDAKKMLTAKRFRIDYIEIADADTLGLTDSWDGQQRLVALAAVFIRDVRLIDNLIVSSEL